MHYSTPSHVRKFKNGTMFVIAYVLIAMGLGMIPCAAYNFINGEDPWPFLAPVIVCIVSSVILLTCFRMPEVVKPVDGLVMIGVLWAVALVIGSIPFALSGMHVIDSVYETTSGITTTGSTIMSDFNIYSSGIMMWRSILQWIGGIAIIIIFMFIMPMIGFSGRDLFGNETSGTGGFNFSLKLRDAAKQFVFIYFIMTVMLVSLLTILGVDIYDSLCISFSTISTGGFAPREDSITGYRALVKIAVMIFMFMGGTNFYLHFKVFQRGRFTDYAHNEEFRLMLFLNIVFSMIAFLLVGGASLAFGMESANNIVDITFNIVSASTTTGFVSSNYDLWTPTAVLILFLLAMIGGSSGSTSGGIKVGRLFIVLRYTYNGLKNMLHPKAVYDVRLNESSVNPNAIPSSITIIILFFLTLIVGTAVIMFNGLDFQTSITVMIAHLTTFGPSTGIYGAVGNYSTINPLLKMFLAFIMWLGRIELLTGLILLTPGFWKEYYMSRRKKMGAQYMSSFKR